MITNRDELTSILTKNVATITFTKKDGTSRDMICTLREDILSVFTPQETEKSEKKTRKMNPDVLAVWDVEKKAWRSFRVDSVEFIKIDGEDN